MTPDQDLFLAQLKSLGGSAGNGKLQAFLGWDDERYTSVKNSLVAAAQIESGRGRGGSIKLTGHITPDKTPIAPNQDVLPGLPPPPKPVKTLPPPAPARDPNATLIKADEDTIWNIANLLRGPYRPPQYRRVMIPLIVLRRLDCVLQETKSEVLALYKKLKADDQKPEAIEKVIKHKTKTQFYNVSEFTFAKLLGDPDKLAGNLGNFIAGFSSNARKIIEKFKFDEEIAKLEEANRLFEVVKEMSRVDLHPNSLSNIEMGLLFENLVRRFNEQANEEAGDHFTPREVIKLMVSILFSHDNLVYEEGRVIRIYDPTCGTGGMLSESENFIKGGLNLKADVHLFGQEYNPESYAICGSDLMIKGEESRNIVFGDTLGTGKPKDGIIDGDGHPEIKFHFMLANPPFGVEWKPQKDHVTREHNERGFSGRFGPGLPRINDGALLFLMHMISKMQPASVKADALDGSRIAIVFNGSPLFTGDAGSGESNIRRWIIENDMLEAVIGLPDQLFYNTGISTYIWIVTNRKRPARVGKIQLINGTDFAWKMKKSLGDKRKFIGDGNDGSPKHIDILTQIYHDFQNDARLSLGDIRSNVEPERDQKKPHFVSKIFNNRDFGYLKITVERPLRLNFAITPDRLAHFEKSLAVKFRSENRFSVDATTDFLAFLKALESPQIYTNRSTFRDFLTKAYSKHLGFKSKLDPILEEALFTTDGLALKDPEADICLDSKGRPEIDADLRDTENVPLPPNISLPLPLDYEGKQNKGKVDIEPLLRLVKQHCEDYLKVEVLPYRPDAWIDHSKTKVGYEIPFNRHFYEYEEPRPLNVIEAEIKTLEEEILAMLKDVTA